MAKAKSLTSLIDKLINDIGGSEPPNLGEIKSQLMTFRTFAKSLEDGQATAQSEEKIGTLETKVRDLEGALTAANAEIKQFRAEKAQREKKDADLHPHQFEILKLLPAPGAYGMDRYEIIRRLPHIPEDELAEHLIQLRNREYTDMRYGMIDEERLSRSETGNRYVIAKRLAGEEETAAKKKFKDLPELLERMLAMMIGKGEGVPEELIQMALQDAGERITLEKVKHILRTQLEPTKFADYDDEEATYGAGNTWFITELGNEYFYERGKL